jgi:DedD protein
VVKPAASQPAQTTTKPAVSQPAQTTVKPAASVATQSKPAAPAEKQQKPVQTRIYDDYWVQAGAFSTITRAEGAKETLAAKGITSIIENRDMNGNTLFRVRIGPYTSQNEANYWLSLIKSIGGFEDSQVRMTRRN